MLVGSFTSVFLDMLTLAVLHGLNHPWLLRSSSISIWHVLLDLSKTTLDDAKWGLKLLFESSENIATTHSSALNVKNYSFMLNDVNICWIRQPLVAKVQICFHTWHQPRLSHFFLRITDQSLRTPVKFLIEKLCKCPWERSLSTDLRVWSFAIALHTSPFLNLCQ